MSRDYTYDESKFKLMSESKLISADSISRRPASVAAFETAFSSEFPIPIIHVYSFTTYIIALYLLNLIPNKRKKTIFYDSHH